jgi:hypothetical protein
MRLQLHSLAQAPNRTPNGRGGLSVHRPRAPCNAFPASLGIALPDTDGRALHRVLSAERACVSRMLGNLHLLDLLTKRRSITRSILSDNADLARALPHGDALVDTPAGDFSRLLDELTKLPRLAVAIGDQRKADGPRS